VNRPLPAEAAEGEPATFVICTGRGQHNDDVFGVLIWSHGADGAQWTYPSSPPRRQRDPGMGTDHYRPGRRARIRYTRLDGDPEPRWQFGPCRFCGRNVPLRGGNVERLRPAAEAAMAAGEAYTFDVSLLPTDVGYR
jgi:hypothetical protein